MHVHSKGSDEPQAQVMAESPSVAVAAEVPSHQKAIHSGVRQNRLRPRVKVMYVHHTALILWIQEPERDSAAHWSDCKSDTDLSVMVLIYLYVAAHKVRKWNGSK